MRRTILLSVFLLAICAAVPAASGAEPHADLPPSHSVRPQLVATGFEFAEGPALNARGDLFVVNYRANGNIGQIKPDTTTGAFSDQGTARVFCDLRQLAPVEGHLPRANGLKVDRQGRLIAADSGAGRLLRISADGKNVEVLADRWEGNRFNAVNDVALDRQGNIYFSDPGGSSADNPVGSIYRYDITTAKVSQLDTELAFPNGLGVIPGKVGGLTRRYLCLSESSRYRLLIYDLSEEGKVSNRRVLIDFPAETEGEIVGGKFVPDGMIFDAAGRLYVGMWTGGVVNVVGVPSGKLIRQYNAGGGRATNCHFHGGYLYVTVAAKEAVFRLKLGVKAFDYNGTMENESNSR